MGSPGYGGEGPLIMGIAWAEFAIAALFVLARWYTNVKVTRETGWDFWWALATLFIGFISQICHAVAAHFGLGNDTSKLAYQDSSNAILWTWIGLSIAIFAIALSKLAVIAFLLRVQGHAGRWGRYFLWFLAVTNVIINLFETILVMLQCEPSRKLWMPDTPGHCYVRDNVNIVSGYLQGAWNALSDIILALYPAYLFWHIQMPLKLKVGVSCLMATGLAAGACAIAKTWEIRQTHVTDNVTEALSALTILNCTELWVTLIAASIPAVWPVVTYMRHGRRGDKYERQHDPSSFGRSHGSVRYSDVGRDENEYRLENDVPLEMDFDPGHTGGKGPTGMHTERSSSTGHGGSSQEPFQFERNGSLDDAERARTPSIHERPQPNWPMSDSGEGSAGAHVEHGSHV